MLNDSGTALNYSNGVEGSFSELPEGLSLLLIALNILIAVFTLLGNVLILVSLQRVSSMHRSTKLLFRCLAVADLCMALTPQPFHLTSLFRGISKVNLAIYSDFRNMMYLIGFLLCEISFFISTILCLDRFLALYLGLRYRIHVTLWRVRFIIISFILIGISNGLVFVFLSRTDALIISVVLAIVSASV